MQEVRAWTFIKGMTAPQCAGVIHSDFERGFIRAETVSYDESNILLVQMSKIYSIKINFFKH